MTKMLMVLISVGKGIGVDGVGVCTYRASQNNVTFVLCAPLHLGVTAHHVDVGPNSFREIDLVDE